MSGRLIAVGIAIGVAGGVARAQPAEPVSPAVPDPGSSTSTPPSTPAAAVPAATPASPASPASPGDEPGDELGDQGISAELGLAGGGRVTPGGLRIAGHYLYQLSARDWFDGAVSFTFGSGHAACFRDRQDALVCNHGPADGSGIEVSASVRRMFAPQGAFRPFARVGLGIGLVRFGDDDVSGVAIPLHGGGGVRVSVAPSIAVVAEGELTLGLGKMSRGLGLEPQLGLAVSAGAEFRLP